MNDEKLIANITEQRNSLSTDRLDMSYGELMSLYEKNDLVISPKFQRLFRWDISRRSKFLESILLGIPVPPIFVAEDSDGRWELVDGLQRTSTILSFFGKLKNNDNNNWILEAGSLVPELEGYSSSNLPEKYLRNILRTYCRVEIIKWNSKYDMRYELFNRLNTGGESLSEQEIRNCIFRGTSEEFNEVLKELSEIESFNKLLYLTKKQKEQLYIEELVLRFFALYYSDLSKIKTKNLSMFMTDFMKQSIEENSLNYEEARTIFYRVVNVITQLDGAVFKFSNNQFSTSLYDAVMIGIAKNIEYYENQSKEYLAEKIEELKNNMDFRKYVGSASSSKTRVVNRMKVSLAILGEN